MRMRFRSPNARRRGACGTHEGETMTTAATIYNRYAHHHVTDHLLGEVETDAHALADELSGVISHWKAGRSTFGQLTYALVRIGESLQEIGEHADDTELGGTIQDEYRTAVAPTRKHRRRYKGTRHVANQ